MSDPKVEIREEILVIDVPWAEYDLSTFIQLQASARFEMTMVVHGSTLTLTPFC